MTQLEHLMRTRGLTQKAFAAQLALSTGRKTTQSTVAGWVSGDHRPHPAVIPALATFFGWPVPKMVKAIEAHYRKNAGRDAR